MKWSVFFFSLLLCAAPTYAAEKSIADDFNTELHGYGEIRSGWRMQDDPHEKDISVMESRLQLEALASSSWIDLKYKGDVWGDGVSEKAEYDTREAYVFTRPAEFIDLKAGRQVLTWGTGDLVFVNDLFPKDWRSFFIGRDAEYLKAPSDALKIGLFSDVVNLDVVYTPQFDPDRYVTGKYVSYWHGQENRIVGRDHILSPDKPDTWFQDDEIALRLYKNIEGYELAGYGYSGFWKTPVGQSASGTYTFPRLNVYGSSLRGQLGSGIGNAEIAYYQSLDDEKGKDAKINNSEMRYLVGYTQEIGKDFNASAQYYVEQMLDYDAYTQNLISGHARDRFRHVITMQLTKLLMNQNLKPSLSGYYSPSDKDAYLRPNVQYKFTDQLTFETGANIFFGERNDTFFGQFKNDTNIYVSARYSF